MMGSVSGRVLIAGTASLLLCLFLSPKFIEFLRRREFGQNIREEGPEGHKTKAGTPTMGGIIIMIAFAIPFLILSNRDWRSIGVLGALGVVVLAGVAWLSGATFKGRVGTGNEVMVSTHGLKQLTVWLGRDMLIDFDKPVKVLVNGV